MMDVFGSLRLQILHLEEEMDELDNAMKALTHQSIEVERRLELALERMIEPREAVSQWLARVSLMESDVSDTLKQGSLILDRNSCLGGLLCPINHWTRYKFRKRLVQNLELVKGLIEVAPFSVGVVDRCSLPATTETEDQGFPTVGLDSTFAKAWNLLEQDGIGKLALYGMGGVGKTTLLKKIHNKYFETGYGYDFVIWVTVSKELNMRRIQKDIGLRLGLSWPETIGMTRLSEEISKVLKGKKFVLLLDDLWQPLDLPSIGISLHDHNSKIIFTTRSEIVCIRMAADTKIRVQCLTWWESLDLFQSIVGPEILDSCPLIRPIAKQIVKQCLGIPLALITVARAMAGQSTIQAWQAALWEIAQSPTTLQGMEEDIYSTLKFSYDKLPNDSIRSCFLFCSLYPQDFEIPIEPLIIRWLGQGYIDGFHDLNKSIDTGHSIIHVLTSSGFLIKCGEGNLYVKMHDIIWDFAMWISHDHGEHKYKVLVQTGSEVCVAPMPELWMRAQTISLAHTLITELYDIPKCPNLISLLLFGSSCLMQIHDSFFQFMPALRFLDLSGTCIAKLPTSIGELVRLEFLDISFTLVRELPRETMKLIRLKYLFAEGKGSCPQIPSGVIVHLLNLEMLKLSDSYFGHFEEERARGIEELACLDKLKALEIKISDAKVLEGFLQKPQLMLCTRSFILDGEPDGNASGIMKLALSPTPSYLSLGFMKKLRELRIRNSQEIEELVIHSSAEDEELLESLETLSLEKLPKLVVSWDINNYQGLGFRNLHHVTIIKCDAMPNLIWLLLVPNLQTLFIESCGSMEDILPDGAHDVNTFSNLKVLVLKDLPHLQHICFPGCSLSSLKAIRVFNCPELRSLPLDSNSARNNTLKYIKGEADWWNNLRWEDETVKYASTPLFYPVG